ncbi:MAG: RidA family protein [Chloroflexia bacterium]
MKQRVRTDKAPGAIGPYSQALIVNGIVYTSGQIAINPATGKLVEGGLEEQAHRVLQNVKAVLEAAGTTLDNVVRTTVFLSTMDNFTAMNAIYVEYFNTDTPPARSTIAAAGLPLGALIEIDTIATLS